MKNKFYRKTFSLGIIILSLGIIIFPCVNGNSIIEKNAVEYSNVCVEFAIFRQFMFGPIHNLSYNQSNGTFIFKSKNLRLFVFSIYFNHGSLDFDTSYEHWIDWQLFDYSGEILKFRGLVKPTFICGYLYLNFLTP